MYFFVCVRSLQTFCNPMDCSLQGSSVHGILQARILEWVVIPSPGDLPSLGIEPGSPALQTDSLPAELLGKLLSLTLNITHYYNISDP